MKKIIIAALVLVSTGISSFDAKKNNVQPAFNTISKAVFTDKKDLASGD